MMRRFVGHKSCVVQFSFANPFRKHFRAFVVHQSASSASMIWSTSASLGDDLLIGGWSVVSGGQFVGTSAVVLFVAVVYELLALARPIPKDALRPRAIVRDCGVVAVRSFLGYVLMLVVMSMNLWLLVCASLGAALGHGFVLHRKHGQQSPRTPADHTHDSEPLLE